jgi:hypothetical protein
MSELLRDYASRLNVPAKGINSREESAAILSQQQQLEQQRQQALVGKDLTTAGKNLSETDVGGGENALQRLIGA